MTDASTTLLVAIALLTTHAKQPKGRDTARALQDLRDRQTTAPKENEHAQD